MANINEGNFSHAEKDERVIPTANVYSSPEITGGIHKSIILLYSIVMSNY